MMESELWSERQGRLFTLEEANALLPQVRDSLAAIQERAARIGQLQARLAAFREQKQSDTHAVQGEGRMVVALMQEAEQIAVEIRSAMAELAALGCELKDVQLGLVDFPALREDRVVYLCWRAGEDEIRYWHELDAGFAGRQPL